MKSALCGIAVFVLALAAGCCSTAARDARGGFVALAEAVPDVILEPRYYSTYNFVGELNQPVEPDGDGKTGSVWMGEDRQQRINR